MLQRRLRSIIPGEFRLHTSLKEEDSRKMCCLKGSLHHLHKLVITSTLFDADLRNAVCRLHNFLSPEECQYLIDQVESQSYCCGK